MSGAAVTLLLMTKIIASGDSRAGQRGIKLDIADPSSHTPRVNIEPVIVLTQLRELGSIAVAARIEPESPDVTAVGRETRTRWSGGGRSSARDVVR
jgi:hypothetical protein